MKVLDLCSGIGGFSLGLGRAGMETIAFCEIESYPQRILKKHWPDVPIADDIYKLSYNFKTKQLFYKTKVIYVGSIELICGGYPCQPFSTAGKRRGKQDDRHLWPQMLRLIREIHPRWVIAENVAGHISMGLDDVLSDLEKEDYSTWPFVIPACAVDAKHRRDRVWILTTNTEYLRSAKQECEHQGAEVVGGSGENGVDAGQTLANANGARLQEQHATTFSSIERLDSRGINAQRRGIRWPVEPGVGRVANGIPRELDLYRGLIYEQGNDKKANSETVRVSRWRLLRAMWENRGLAKASPDLYAKRLHDCVPEMPHGDPHEGWNLGSWIEKSKGLRDLWEEFYSKSFQESQNLQQELLERIRKIERSKEVGPTKNRVDRIKGLGNAVVPQIPEILGRAILEAEEL